MLCHELIGWRYALHDEWQKSSASDVLMNRESPNDKFPPSRK